MATTSCSPSKRCRSDAECLDETANPKRGKYPKLMISKSTPPESRRQTRSMTQSIRACPGTKQSLPQRQNLALDSKETATSPRQGHRCYMVAKKPMSDRQWPNLGEILYYFQTLKGAGEYVWDYYIKLDDGHVLGIMLDTDIKDEKSRYPRLLRAIGSKWEVSIRMHHTGPEKSGNDEILEACWLEHCNANLGPGGLRYSSGQDDSGENFSDDGYYSGAPGSSGSPGPSDSSNSSSSSSSSSASSSSRSSGSSGSYHTAYTHFSDDSFSSDEAAQSSHARKNRTRRMLNHLILIMSLDQTTLI